MHTYKIQLLHHCYLCWYHCCFYFFFFLYVIMDWSVSVFIASNSFPVDNCIQLYCMFLDMCQLVTHIYTYILVHIHFWYTYYKCTVYLLNTCMTYLSTIFVCLYLYILQSNGGVDWCIYIYIYIYIYVYTVSQYY